MLSYRVRHLTFKYWCFIIMLNNLRASRHVYGVGELQLWEFAYFLCPGVICIIYCSSSARMLTYFEICVARLLYAGCPACELRDTVIALAYTFARRGSVLPWLFDTRLPGWDLYDTVLWRTFPRVRSLQDGSWTHNWPDGIYRYRGI